VSRILGCGLALCFLAGAPAGAAPAPSEELKALRSKLEGLKRDIARSESSRSEAADALRSSEQAISDANRKLAELAASKERADRELEELHARQQALERHLGKQRELAARLVYQQYTASPAGPLQALASGRNPNEIARTSAYLDYIARARRQILESLRKDSEALRALSEAAAARQTELSDIQREQLAERRRLDEERRNRKQVLTGIAAQLERQRKTAGALERDEKRLTKLVQDLARLLAARKPPSPPRTARAPTAERPPAPDPARTAGGDSMFEQLKGRLQPPVRGELIGRFGSPRSDSGLSWRGLFIQAPAGREVKAVAAGRIVFADWLRGFGNLLIVDHGDGFMSLYGNNEALIGRIGDPVRGGDTIATVGASGGNTATGLYFELRHQGKPFDPSGWLNFK
jgi:septal ring factor EnvC (AmiA/AmiB activator)